MSDTQGLSLDLEKAFLPSWAQQPADQNRFADYNGNEGADRGEQRGGRGGFGDRPPRRDGPGGPRRDGPSPGGFGGPRPGGPGGPRRDGRGPRPGGPGGEGGGLKWDPTAGGDKPPFRGGRRDDRREREPEPLPPIEVEMRPDPAGVVSLARQIKLSGRAYPLLEIASLVVQKPDRYEITFRPMKDKEGKAGIQFFLCSLDDSVWLSEREAVAHVLRAHFDTFYGVEKAPCDPPKGVWTLVAQFEEVILGPPNYHGYQEKLRELHAQRAPRLPFEVFKGKIRMVKDEAAVKSWLEGQSSKQEFIALNVEEPQTLHSMAAVEEHFRAKHAPNVIKQTDVWSLNRQPNAPRLPEPFMRVLRVNMERERRFPIRTMTALSGAFAHAGLQFFKRDKTAVHVAVARPHYLDLENILVQPGVKRIIEFINTTDGPTRRKLIAALAPSPVVEAAPAPVAEATAPAEPKDGPAPEAAAPAAEAPAAPAAAPTPTAEQQALLSDLHWLIHQGHVIEFANGLLETAKRPQPKPEAPAQAAKPKQTRADKPKKERPLTKQGRYVSDNCGLLFTPSPNAALVGL
jgi:hypothetical protein